MEEEYVGGTQRNRQEEDRGVVRRFHKSAISSSSEHRTKPKSVTTKFPRNVGQENHNRIVTPRSVSEGKMPAGNEISTRHFSSILSFEKGKRIWRVYPKIILVAFTLVWVLVFSYLVVYLNEYNDEMACYDQQKGANEWHIFHNSLKVGKTLKTLVIGGKLDRAGVHDNFQATIKVFLSSDEATSQSGEWNIVRVSEKNNLIHGHRPLSNQQQQVVHDECNSQISPSAEGEFSTVLTSMQHELLQLCLFLERYEKTTQNRCANSHNGRQPLVYVNADRVTLLSGFINLFPEIESGVNYAINTQLIDTGEAGIVDMSLILFQNPTQFLSVVKSALKQHEHHFGADLYAFLTQQNDWKFLSGVCHKIHNDEQMCQIYNIRENAVVSTIVHEDKSPQSNFSTTSYSRSSVHIIPMTTNSYHPQSNKMFPISNFYDQMLELSCLPQQLSSQCTQCLYTNRPSSCARCRDVCTCYCTSLCHIRPPLPPISNIYAVYNNHPRTAIPPVIHQLWYHAIPDDAFNMRRAVESWRTKMSNERTYKHYFWTQKDAELALTQDSLFPPEVWEAYHALTTPKHMLELLKYMTLLIHGGVVVEPTIMRDGNLDSIFYNKIDHNADSERLPTFVTGSSPLHKATPTFCLHNGFIAATPGHPYTARVIEFIVNGVRNRHTSIDYDDLMCPYASNYVGHTQLHPSEFTVGGCILGMAINSVLGREKTHPLYPEDRDYTLLYHNPNDMGSRRFTDVRTNLMVYSTDFGFGNIEDANIRIQKQNEISLLYGDVYGTAISGGAVYKDRIKSGNEIRLRVSLSPPR